MITLDARGLPPTYPFRPELEVTPRDVREGLEAGSVFLVDCRTAGEHGVAKIDGAILVPLDELAERVEWVEDRAGDKKIVVHCHMGGRSMKAALFLRSRGVGAASMAGGIDLWALDIDPRVPRY